VLPLLFGCAPDRPDIVLISLDTTRADVIDARTTPNLWALASRGVRFQWALAHTPTTLSSHASVWTGRDPHGHTIPRNGYALPAGLPVLAERMAQGGFDTIGIIGSSALSRPMGMDRGFRIWGEHFSGRRIHQFESLAEEVTDRALKQVERRKRGLPLFLFAHYFDAHGPYDAPEPWKRKWVDPAYAGFFDGSPEATQKLVLASREGTALPEDIEAARARYRGEVSYVDDQVGRLLRRFDDPFIVVFADHGEVLGDTRERRWGHGSDVDLEATHVPLIVAGPGIPPRGVDTPVAVSDIGATVLGLAGIDGGLGQGRDLSASWRGDTLPVRPIFLEATQPRNLERTDAWNNLDRERGVVRDAILFIHCPAQGTGPDLIGLGRAATDLTIVPMMRELLHGWDAAAPPYRKDEMDDVTREGLKALGYLE